MRTLAAILLVSTTIGASTLPCAADSISSDAAVSRALSAGYRLVSKTEAAPGAWDIWASKDGIAYEVKIDARNGSLMTAIPLDDND